MTQYVHIADGFVDDCEELIQRCLQSDTLNFHVFCNIWKDMNFVYIFQGRTSSAEIAELSEEVIHIAKRYMIAETSNFEETVAGLFLVYGLVQLQPLRGFAKLRITPRDIGALHRIENVAREHKRYDALYILRYLLMESEYHIADREYGLEAQLRNKFDPASSLHPAGVRARGVYYRQNEELGLLRELSSLSLRYTAAKADISGGKKPDVTLSYADEHLASDLAASLKHLVSGNKPANIASAAVRHDEAVSSIKHRAMTETVGRMRHMQSVSERKKKKSNLPVSPTKTDIKSKPGKVKIGSPKKPIPTNKRTPKLARPRKTTEKDTNSIKAEKSKMSEDPSVATNIATTPKSVRSVSSTKSDRSKKSVDTEVKTNSAKSPKSTKDRRNIKAKNVVTKPTSPIFKTISRDKKRTNSATKITPKKRLFNEERSSSSDDSDVSVKYADSDIDVSTERERDSSIENAETIDDVLLKLKKKEEAKKLREEARKIATEDRASRKYEQSIDDEIPVTDKDLVETVASKVADDDANVPDLIMPDKPKRVRKKVHSESRSIATRGGAIKVRKEMHLYESEKDSDEHKTPVSKKLPLRKLKQHMKSKLRRLGLLDVLTGTEEKK